MVGIYGKADMKEAQNKQKKANDAREVIFNRLISLLKQNFVHQGLSTKTVSLKAGTGLEVHFKEIMYENFIAEAKKFIVRVTLNQIVCTIIPEDTIRFSIIEEHLNSFKNRFEDLTFEQFLKTSVGLKNDSTNSISKETTTYEQEIVAPSENLNSSQTNKTEMTTQTATPKTTTLSKLAELLVSIENFLSLSDYQHGRHYMTLEIDEEHKRINLKATTPSIRQEIEGNLTKANISYEKPVAENTKTLWFKLPKINFFTKETKKEIQVYLKGKKLLNTIINPGSFSLHFRTSAVMKTAYDFIVAGNLYEVRPVNNPNSRSFWIVGKIDSKEAKDELTPSVVNDKPYAKVSKAKAELSKEEQEKFKALRLDVNNYLLQSGKFNYKNYEMGPFNPKQNFVPIYCSESFESLESILEFLLPLYDVDKSPRGKKTLWVFGKKAYGLERIIREAYDKVAHGSDVKITIAPNEEGENESKLVTFHEEFETNREIACQWLLEELKNNKAIKAHRLSNHRTHVIVGYSKNSKADLADNSAENVVEAIEESFYVSSQVDDDSERKQFESSMSSLQNLYRLYLEQKKEIAELNTNSGLSREDLLICGGFLHDLIAKTDLNTLLDKELFIEKLFYPVFIENKD